VLVWARERFGVSIADVAETVKTDPRVVSDWVL
jgi:predicted transcriptional regulator